MEHNPKNATKNNHVNFKPFNDSDIENENAIKSIKNLKF